MTQTSTVSLPAAHPAPTTTALPDRLLVEVNSEDILLGKRRNGRECPGARATRRALALLGYRPLSVVVGSAHGGYSTVSVQLVIAGPFSFYQFKPGPWLAFWDVFGVAEPRSFELVRL